MMRFRRPVVARRRMAGLSLIEMMIALVMALIVAAGIIAVFTSTSSSNKVQGQMATLQEGGRFAIQSLRNSLASANGGYCSNTGGNATSTAGTGSGLYLDALRSPVVYSPTALTFADNTVTGLPAPTQAYSLPSSLFMRGYQCSTTACTPADPSTGTVPTGSTAIPAMGTAVGDRVKGADVLTIRYLKPKSGWAIVASGSSSGSTIQAATGSSVGSVDTVTLNPLSGEDPITDFTGTLAMLADCSNAQVFAVSDASGVLTPTGANYAAPLDISKGAAPRVFDFKNDFQTVTYWLKVVDAGNGHTTGELERRVNGTNQPLVRGVERLDFLYGIVNVDGKTQFLNADQVDTRNGGAINCPPGNAADMMLDPVPALSPPQEKGCLWRAVQTIQVHVLMDGQTPLYTLTPSELAYIYSPDGGTTPTKPSLHAVKPNADQGFPLQLIRREFTTLVSLRNYNP